MLGQFNYIQSGVIIDDHYHGPMMSGFNRLNKSFQKANKLDVEDFKFRKVEIVMVLGQQVEIFLTSLFISLLL